MSIYLESTLKLILAVILGGTVGYEREHKSMPAGLRTHILVCTGAALVQITAINYMKTYGTIGFDPMRLGAQVISGIGFLGAGTIIKDKNTVKGLTTAASVWVVACIGIAVGTGFYFEGLLTTIIIFISLKGFKSIEENILRVRRSSILKVKINNVPGKLGQIAGIMGNLNINIENVEISDIENGQMWIELTVKIPKNVNDEIIVDKLTALEGVYDIQFVR